MNYLEIKAFAESVSADDYNASIQRLALGYLDLFKRIQLIEATMLYLGDCPPSI